jgi:hypothetical protein
MEQVRLGLQEGKNVKEYEDPFLDACQMADIREGKEADTDEPDELQSQEILKGLMSGVDVSIYADTAYDYRQMEQIRLGLEAGVDVTPLLNIHMSADDMEKVRLGL